MKKSPSKTKTGETKKPEMDENLVGQVGVRRFRQKDGSGRADWYWVANMMIEAKQNAKRWSISKHGDKGAHNQAVAQRLEWEKLKLSKDKEKAEAKKAKEKAEAKKTKKKVAAKNTKKKVAAKSAKKKVATKKAKPKARK